MGLDGNRSSFSSQGVELSDELLVPVEVGIVGAAASAELVLESRCDRPASIICARLAGFGHGLGQGVGELQSPSRNAHAAASTIRQDLYDLLGVRAGSKRLVECANAWAKVPLVATSTAVRSRVVRFQEREAVDGGSRRMTQRHRLRLGVADGRHRDRFEPV